MDPTERLRLLRACACTVLPALTAAMAAPTRPTASHQVRRPSIARAPAMAASAPMANTRATNMRGSEKGASIESSRATLPGAAAQPYHEAGGLERHREAGEGHAHGGQRNGAASLPDGRAARQRRRGTPMASRGGGPGVGDADRPGR